MRHTQNRRSRGRNRKGPNPLTRSYESNGPDVKVRGTAAHVAEKYSTLARDAQVSGDMISAENFLQHAEHYYRIVAAAQQAQFQQAQQAQQAQQRDGSNDERDDGRPVQNLDNNEGRDQLDGPPKSVDDRAADGADDADGGDDAGLAQPERDVAGGGHDKAERPRRSRRPRATTSDEASAGTASAEPKPEAAPNTDAGARDATRPNGRRRKPAEVEGAAEEPKPAEVEGDATQDGASALAAFRD